MQKLKIGLRSQDLELQNKNKMNKIDGVTLNVANLNGQIENKGY